MLEDGSTRDDARAVEQNEGSELDREGPDYPKLIELAAEIGDLQGEAKGVALEIRDEARKMPKKGADAETAAALLGLAEKAEEVERTIWQRLSGVIGVPVRMVKDYFEARQERALAIPDNPKIIRQINKEIDTLRDRRYKAEKELKSRALAENGGSEKVMNVVCGYHAGENQMHDSWEYWRRNDIIPETGKATQRFLMLMAERDKAELDEIYDLYARAKKTEGYSLGYRHPWYYTNEKLGALVWTQMKACAVAGDIGGAVEWWKKCPYEMTMAMAKRFIEYCYVNFLAENKVKFEEKQVRSEIWSVKRRIDQLVDNISQAAVSVPMLSACAQDAKAFLYSECFSIGSGERELVKNFSNLENIEDIWRELDDDAKNALVKYVTGNVSYRVPASEVWDKVSRSNSPELKNQVLRLFLKNDIAFVVENHDDFGLSFEQLVDRLAASDYDRSKVILIDLFLDNRVHLTDKNVLALLGGGGEWATAHCVIATRLWERISSYAPPELKKIVAEGVRVSDFEYFVKHYEELGYTIGQVMAEVVGGVRRKRLIDIFLDGGVELTLDQVNSVLEANSEKGIRDFGGVLSLGAICGLYNRGVATFAVYRELCAYDKKGNSKQLTDNELREKYKANNKKIEEFFKFAAANKDKGDFANANLVEMILAHPDKTDDVIKIVTEFCDFGLSASFVEAFMENFEKIVAVAPEKRATVLRVLNEVAISPSQEVKRVATALYSELMSVEDPVDAYRRVEEIFIKNNLPLVGKVYKVFEILHPPERLDAVLQNDRLSPYLRGASKRGRMFTIFADLLRVHIDSGNRSLRQYLEVLKEGERFFATLDSSGAEYEARPAELRKIKHYIMKLNTLYLNSQMPETTDSLMIDDEVTIDSVRSAYEQLKTSLGVKPGQTTNERVVELFVSPGRYKSIDQILERMSAKKKESDQRGRSLSAYGGFTVRRGDLLKAVNGHFIGSILQNGSVAKEYLGASSDSDATPLDTDLEGISEEQEKAGFAGCLEKANIHPFGDIVFVYKNRGQYYESTKENVGDYSHDKYELYLTGVVSDRHYGVRTGVASTEIDFVICKRDNFERDQKIVMEIVKNGYYIPVVDEEGKVLFTPEMYDEKRRAFAGIKTYDGGRFILSDELDGGILGAEADELGPKLEESRREVNAVLKSITATAESVLLALGVALKESYDTSLLGAELLDTGSTGRHTNTPGNFDFDLVLKLDITDEKKVPRIVSALGEKMRPTRDESHSGNTASDLMQLRFFGATGLGENPVDVDIAFVKKSELSVYGSHDAVRDRLDNIREEYGEAAYNKVLRNIILAKELLKKGGAYKKMEHGGMGGIGVENWVLANGGSITEAFRTFKRAAYDNGRRRSLEEFRKEYEIVDPGINVKFLAHDNFVQLLKEDGYNKMLDVIDQYLT